MSVKMRLYKASRWRRQDFPLGSPVFEDPGDDNSMVRDRTGPYAALSIDYGEGEQRLRHAVRRSGLWKDLDPWQIAEMYDLLLAWLEKKLNER